MREPLLIEIGPGELIDRLSILHLKRAHASPAPQPAILEQIEALEALHRSLAVEADDVLAPLAAELEAINRRLWDIEDALRTCEAEQRFYADFVALARRVYLENDQRGRVKAAIDEALGLAARDVKIYHRSRRAAP